MISLKIQCPCGQRFVFDVEPVDGHMPIAVTCPACGADDTAVANAALAQNLPAPPPMADAPADAGHLRLTPRSAAPPPADSASSIPADFLRAGAPQAGQMDRTKAEHEAKAKIFWGDEPAKVVSFLRMQGFSPDEASSFVRAMTQERAAATRANGVRKIVIGIGMMLVPVVAYFIFTSMGYLPIKLFGMTVAVGLWGGWMAFDGIFMVAAPKMESGDVADQ